MDQFQDIEGGEIAQLDDALLSMLAAAGALTGGPTIGKFCRQRSSQRSCRISDQFMPAPEECGQQHEQQPLYTPPILHPTTCDTLASDVRFFNPNYVSENPAPVWVGNQSHNFVQTVDVEDDDMLDVDVAFQKNTMENEDHQIIIRTW